MNLRRVPCPLHSLAALALVVAAGCESGGPRSAAEDPPATLTALAESIRVAPGATGTLKFQLHSQSGRPVPRQTVRFTIVDLPETPQVDAKGATLSVDTTVTDAAGVAETRVTTGLPAVFRVRATSGALEADAVIVAAGDAVGNVEVAPFFAPGSTGAASSSEIRVFFVDDATCASLSPYTAPASQRPVRRLPLTGGVAVYEFISIGGQHAIIARAQDGRGLVRSLGCVDLAGSTLVIRSTVTVAVPMRDHVPDPVGQFAASSRLEVPRSSALARAVAAPWIELADCPYDPAQRWIDCTLDALSGPSPDDPEDCVPASEGDLGDRLTARRGQLVPAAALPGGTACRGPTDATGQPSLELVVTGLFPSPPSGPLASLAALADDATALLDAVLIRSRLSIETTPVPGRYQATHVVTGFGFTLATGAADVLGLPLLTEDGAARFVSAATVDGALVLERHRVSVALGRAARVAFSRAALGARGLPSDAGGLVAALLASAGRDAGAVRVEGCAALDAALCAELGAGAGCLGDACPRGAATLAALLDGSFAAADGEPGDAAIMLSGSAPLLDIHASGRADRLGDVPPAGIPGLWSAELQTRTGSLPWTAVWSADRTDL